MKLVYFAWVRDQIGLAEEEVARPEHVHCVSDVLDWLEGRGANYERALADRSALRVAVNQEFARPDDQVGNDDEIAVFPPVTGG